MLYDDCEPVHLLSGNAVWSFTHSFISFLFLKSHFSHFLALCIITRLRRLDPGTFCKCFSFLQPESIALRSLFLVHHSLLYAFPLKKTSRCVLCNVNDVADKANTNNTYTNNIGISQGNRSCLVQYINTQKFGRNNCRKIINILMRFIPNTARYHIICYQIEIFISRLGTATAAFMNGTTLIS